MLFVRGTSTTDLKQHRDNYSGSWKTKNETLADLLVEHEPKAPAADLKLPKISKPKLAKIGQAILEGCHNQDLKGNDKTNILNMLLGKVPQATIQQACSVGQKLTEKVKKHGVIKTGQVTKKNNKKRRIRNISDKDLKQVLETISTPSCRVKADKSVLKTVAQ